MRIWVVASQVMGSVEDKPGPAMRRNQRPAGCGVQLEHHAADGGLKVLETCPAL